MQAGRSCGCVRVMQDNPARRRHPRSETDWTVLVLIGLGVLALAAILRLTRGTTFMQDEWDFIQGRRGGDAHAFFRPHNNHLLVLVVLFYKAIWTTVGLNHYWVVRLATTLVHLACVGLLFAVLRRRVPALVSLAACVP